MRDARPGNAHFALIRRSFCIASLIASANAQSPPGEAALRLDEQGRAAIRSSDSSGAERLFGDALAIWRTLGPQYEAHAAATLLNLGEARSGAGKWRESIAALEEALLLNRRSLGPRELHTVFNLNALCHAHQFVGDLQRAEAVCAEALVIERELFPNNRLLGETLLGVSLLRRRQERTDEALEAGEESLSASLRAVGEASVETAVAYENVAALHLYAGRTLRAIPLFRKAHFIYEKTLGPENPVTASVISQEGLALLEDGQLRQAEANLSQAIGLLVGAGPAHEHRLAVAETNLGLLRLRQKKLSQSEQLLTHALALQDRIPATSSYNRAATLRALAQLRKAQHRDSESAELMARADMARSER